MKTSVNPRLEKVNERERKRRSQFYQLQLIFFFASVLIESQCMSIGNLILLSLFHGSFIVVLLLCYITKSLDDNFTFIQFFRMLGCTLYYFSVCVLDFGDHHEYTLMVLFVHSTITLPSFSYRKTSESILASLLLMFFIFRICSYCFCDFRSDDKSESFMRKLNHMVFGLAPFGVWFFSELNYGIQELLITLTDEIHAAREHQIKFIKKFAHCCRTNLNGISVFHTHIKKKNKKPENVETIELLEEGNVQTITLVNDLVDFHELKVKQLSLHKEEGNLRNTILNAIKINKEILRTKYKKPDLTLRYRVDDNVPSSVMFDSRRFSQVMHNLISNSIKYTDTGYVYCTAYCKDRNHFFFVVKDTGLGIPKDKLNDVFRPFSSINRSSKPSLGLGLVISKEIANLMTEGKINIESEGKGKGVKATFSCRLEIPAPLTPSSKCTPSPVPFPSTSSFPRPALPKSESFFPSSRGFSAAYLDDEDGRKKEGFSDSFQSLLESRIRGRIKKLSVLVVEDVVTNRAVMNMILSKSGVEDVNFAENGIHALEIFHMKEKMMKKEKDLDLVKKLSEPPPPSQPTTTTTTTSQYYNNLMRGFEEEEEEFGDDEEKPPYDLVLMDINMPVMNGLECTKKLREQWNMTELPIYAVTAKVFTKPEKKELYECFNGLVRKPVEPKKIESVLRNVAEGSVDYDDIGDGRRISVTSSTSTSSTFSDGVQELENYLLRIKREQESQHFSSLSKFVEKVYHATIAVMAFYLVFLAGQEVFGRACIVVLISISLRLLKNEWVNVFAIPFTSLILFHLMFGPCCHSVRLFFLANIVSRSVRYYSSKSLWKAFYVLMVGFVVVAVFEFSDFSGVLMPFFPSMRRLSVESIDVDLKILNGMFDIIFISQIVINMLRLVVSEKEVKEGLLSIMKMLEGDMVFQDNFAAKISHDLRTPIFSSLFLLKKMKRDFKGDRCFISLNLSLSDLKREVDNLVDFYRLKHDKFTVNNTCVPLRELVVNSVNELIDLYKYSTRSDHLLTQTKSSMLSYKKKKEKESEASVDNTFAKPLVFSFNCSDLPVVAKSDKDRIVQVISNIISNAHENTRKGSITINASFLLEEQRTGLLFTVEDTGSGMSEEFQKKILSSENEQMFTRMNSLGLGLVTNREAVRRMGGDIKIESKVGKGTLVEVFFPMEIEGVDQKFCDDHPLNSSSSPSSSSSSSSSNNNNNSKHPVSPSKYLFRRKSICVDIIQQQQRNTAIINKKKESEEIEGEEEEEEEEEDSIIHFEEEEEEEDSYQTKNRTKNIMKKKKAKKALNRKKSEREMMLLKLKGFNTRNSLTIAVVEDNIICTKMMKYYLEKMLGYENVRYADTGAKAVQKVDRDVDICFIDYYLPDATAIELISEIRNKRKNRHTQFCLCTGNLVDDSLVKNEDVMKVLYKPVRLESVKLAITNLCESRRKKKKR